MEKVKGNASGVRNVIRFNWPFYMVSVLLVLAGIIGLAFVNEWIKPWLGAVTGIIAGLTCMSVIVSWYIYDYSDLYELKWAKDLKSENPGSIVNVHAGFDETSAILNQIFPGADLAIFDFFDPDMRTVASIERARKHGQPFPGTQSVKYDHIPLADRSADLICTLFAAHEIRDMNARVTFFHELKRLLTDNGSIAVMEHLRDLPNFLAYTLGSLHFYPRSSWKQVFEKAGLIIKHETRINPFVTLFILKADDSTS